MVSKKRRSGSVKRKRPGPADQGKKDGRSGLGLWVEELRAPFFTATFIPVLLGTIVAWRSEGAFDPLLFVLTLGGVLCLHSGANVANDYFDHLSGNDWVNKEFIRPFTGGSRMIQKGLLEPGSVLRVALTFLAAGGIMGLVLLILTRGWLILLLGVVGIFSGYFYTAPPIRLANRGLGELFIGLNFGVLITIGSFYVQTLMVTLEALVASIPVALLIFLLLYMNEFPDYRADKEVGKDTLVVRLGRRRAVTGYAVLAFLTYVSVLAGVALEILPLVSLLALMTAPVAVLSVRRLRTIYKTTELLAPLCARTVQLHLITGLLLIIAYALDGTLLDGARLL